MSQEPLQPVYAIHGEDRAKVERAVARLVARVAEEGGMPPERFDAAETAGAEIASTCEALSLAGSRLVLVESASEMRAADARAIIAYLESPNPATCLALVSSAPPPGPLLEAVDRAGAVLLFGPSAKASRRDRTAWQVGHVETEVARFGGAIASAAARLLVERVVVDRAEAHKSGANALQLTQEARKLVAAAGGAPIDPALVRALVPEHPDARAYLLADAVLAGDAAGTHDVLSELSSGDEPVPGIVVQATLARQLRAVVEASALGPDASPDDVARVTGQSGYPARKTLEQARALPPHAAERALVRATALELELRVSVVRELGASRDDGERLVLERAAGEILEIARGERA